MIEETIRRIEKSISENETLDSSRKTELQQLIAQLKSEIDGFDESESEHAGSIARYAESSVREAVRSDVDAELLQHSLDGLALSVRRFEVSHPTLIDLINNIGQFINGIGI